MASLAAPFQLEVVLRTLIKPAVGAGGQGTPARTELSAPDAINVATATARAWGFRAARVDVRDLQEALQAMVCDLPLLAGRLRGMRGRALGTLAIEHTGDGVLLTVLESEDVSVDAMGPDTWPQQGVALNDASSVPFYVEPMDTRWGTLLGGQEPLMKVRLCRLADGDILAVSLNHAICDGMRWAALAAHLAARYRECAQRRQSQQPPRPPPPLQPPLQQQQQPGRQQLSPEAARLPGAAAGSAVSELVRPSDRRLLSAQRMERELAAASCGTAGGSSGSGAPPELDVGCWDWVAGAWRVARLMTTDARQRQDLVVLWLPQQGVAQLKRLAAEGDPAVTTGDAVQAAAALLLHAALGRPLLPVAPLSMVALVQLPTPPGYTLGNAAHMLRVNLPAGTPQPAAGDHAGALRQLAGAIRRATAAFRSDPHQALKALRDTERLVAAPIHRMLAFLAARRMPLLTCTTNYVPTQQSIDLGLGQAATYVQGMTMPRARDMAVIRAAVPPFPPGLFVQLSLAPTAAARLRRLPLLAALLPGARFVG